MIWKCYLHEKVEIEAKTLDEAKAKAAWIFLDRCKPESVWINWEQQQAWLADNQADGNDDANASR